MDTKKNTLDQVLHREFIVPKKWIRPIEMARLHLDQMVAAGHDYDRSRLIIFVAHQVHGKKGFDDRAISSIAYVAINSK